MNASKAILALNRLLGLLCRSLPAYLADAPPWTRGNHRRLWAAFERLFADQQLYADRVAKAIVDLGGHPTPGPFPGEFASKNDLSAAFLLREAIDYLEQDISSIEQCCVQLEGDSALHALAEEILGNAKGHLDLLGEVAKAEEAKIAD